MRMKAPEEDVTQALARIVAGERPEAVAADLGYSDRAVYYWLAKLRADEQTDPVATARSQRIRSTALELIQQGLDELAVSDEPRLKHLQTLNIVAGTQQDKLQRQQAPAQDNRVQIIFLTERPALETGPGPEAGPGTVSGAVPGEWFEGSPAQEPKDGS